MIFKHTYREHNSLANALSKLGLKLDMGVVTFSESLDGMIVNQGNLIFFRVAEYLFCSAWFQLLID